MTETTLDWFDFVDRFQPQRNHLDPGPDTAPNDRYETYGSEYAYVLEVHAREPGRVWTCVDCDGELLVISGWHYVNRQYYIITAVPCPPGEAITVD